MSLFTAAGSKAAANAAAVKARRTLIFELVHVNQHRTVEKV